MGKYGTLEVCMVSNFSDVCSAYVLLWIISIVVLVKKKIMYN